MNELKISLPWPAKELSPNGRFHWAVVAKKKAEYRSTARLLALAAGAKQFAAGWTQGTKLNISLTYHPPSKRRYDGDNIHASSKALHDGVADALGIDDRFFRMSYELLDTVGGYINMTITRNEE